MRFNPDHIQTISEICQDIESQKIEQACSRARSAWPFDPVNATKRSISPNRLMELWIRDGFIDRYTGQRLLYPGVLRLLSVLMPNEFPYHPHGKLDECHLIHWELYPSHDHVHAASLGGSNELDNLVTCSMLTNARKGHWSLSQLGWSLLNSGNITDWDGQAAWFVRVASKNQDVLEQSEPIKKWFRVARKHGF